LLYGYDGATFRTVWTPRDIAAEYPWTAVEPVVNRVPNPKGSVVIHEQYVLTVEGPQKSSEWPN
jgi:hypothetical protein